MNLSDFSMVTESYFAMGEASANGYAYSAVIGSKYWRHLFPGEPLDATKYTLEELYEAFGKESEQT